METLDEFLTQLIANFEDGDCQVLSFRKKEVDDLLKYFQAKLLIVSFAFERNLIFHESEFYLHVGRSLTMCQYADCRFMIELAKKSDLHGNKFRFSIFDCN